MVRLDADEAALIQQANTELLQRINREISERLMRFKRKHAAYLPPTEDKWAHCDAKKCCQRESCPKKVLQ